MRGCNLLGLFRGVGGSFPLRLDGWLVGGIVCFGAHPGFRSAFWMKGRDIINKELLERCLGFPLPASVTYQKQLGFRQFYFFFCYAFL